MLRRQFERPRRRWEDHIKMDSRGTECENDNSTELPQNVVE